MSLLFVHDHKFKSCGDKLYSNGCFSDAVLKRYTDLFGEVFFAARIIKEEKIAGLSEVTNTNITVTDAYNDAQKLAGLVAQAEYIIVRLPSVLGLKAIHFARKYNKPYSIELVGCSWDSYRYHSTKGKLVAPFMWFLTKREVKRAKRVLYVSEHFLQKRYPTKGKWVACSNVFLGAEPAVVSEEKDRKKECIVLATAGAVHVKYKGQQYVIKAMAKLIKKGYSFKYRIAGGGDQSYLRSVAEKYGVSDYVEFCGLISADKMTQFYDQTDIYIQPSVTEGLPRAVIEAMSRGCTVIGSDAGGIPELLPEECIFKKKSVSGLERVLKNAADAQSTKWSEININRAKAFKAEILNQRRNEFYRQFIQSPGEEK